MVSIQFIHPYRISIHLYLMDENYTTKITHSNQWKKTCAFSILPPIFQNGELDNSQIRLLNIYVCFSSSPRLPDLLSTFTPPMAPVPLWPSPLSSRPPFVLTLSTLSTPTWPRTSVKLMLSPRRLVIKPLPSHGEQVRVFNAQVA